MYINNGYVKRDQPLDLESIAAVVGDIRWTYMHNVIRIRKGKASLDNDYLYNFDNKFLNKYEKIL
jgi:hypothetical protein